MPDLAPSIYLSASDFRDLGEVAREAEFDRHPVAGFLWGELQRAIVLPGEDLPADVVTLNRWVIYSWDRGLLPERRLLVCPQDYRSVAIHLSVLSPLGAALIGLRTGSRIRYRSIEGLQHTASVECLGADSRRLTS